MKLITILILLLLLVGAAGVAYAQSGGGYNLEWNTVDGGGATFATGGNYNLGGSVGQPDAGTLAGGNYILAGGFWHGGTVVSIQHMIYLPLVLRNAS